MTQQKATRLEPPEVCPICGEDVPRGSLACPECGADHNSGWRKATEIYDAVDLPEEDFNYDEFVRVEFGSAPKPGGVKTIWWVAAVLLLVAFAVLYVRSN